MKSLAIFILKLIAVAIILYPIYLMMQNGCQINQLSSWRR
jgi:hypothetical protein